MMPATGWVCMDKQLGSYEAEIAGVKYFAQRTWLNTVAVWRGSERIAYAPSLDVAWRAVIDEPLRRESESNG